MKRYIGAGIVLGTCATGGGAPTMTAADYVAARQRLMKLNGAS
jgi:hypothetical protein